MSKLKNAFAPSIPIFCHYYEERTGCITTCPVVAIGIFEEDNGHTYSCCMVLDPAGFIVEENVAITSNVLGYDHEELLEESSWADYMVKS